MVGLVKSQGFLPQFKANLSELKQNFMTIFQIKVKPNSKQQTIQEEPDGSLTVRLKSAPVEGKANNELIKLLAERFDVPKSQITIQSGFSSKNKRVEISLPPQD